MKEFVVTHDRMVSSDYSGGSCNKANSWLRIRTNVRRNIHEKCASGLHSSYLVETSVNSFVTGTTVCVQRSAGVPFHSWFRRLHSSKKRQFPRMGSSPSASDAVPSLPHNAHCRADFHRFTRLFPSFRRVQQDLGGLIASRKLLRFQYLFLCSVLFSVAPLAEITARSLARPMNAYGSPIPPGLEPTSRDPLQRRIGLYLSFNKVPPRR